MLLIFFKLFIGDTFVGVFSASLIMGHDIKSSCIYANKAANLTLKTILSVSTDINYKNIFMTN